MNSGYVLETERLIIKKPSYDDVADQLKLQSDPDVMQYIMESGTISEI